MLEANKNHLVLRYGMPAGERYGKEETGKESQLQATCIPDVREKT